MANGRNMAQIKRVRNEILVALHVVYPVAMQADQLLRSLLVLFPTLDFDHLKRDLHYLCEKGYVLRVEAESESATYMTPWRRRWFRLTSSGLEIAEHCVKDPALD